ncbi:MAG: DUF305 domain-containing protein [Pseudomonadota bacterium]
MNIAALLAGTSLAALLSASVAAQQAPILQPGAPGEASRALSEDEAVQLADNRYSQDDVAFMQGMIIHHQQAVDMAALVGDRTNRESLVTLAGRIDATQADEIDFMQSWLTDRGEHAPDPTGEAAMHGDHSAHEGHGDHGGHGAHHGAMDHSNMAGMATPEQMAELAASSGVAFDRLFFELMIRHHEGAIEMVDHLFAQRGSAFDPVLFNFANDVKSEQQAEIDQMSAMLRELDEDPRSNLAAGFQDAEQAIAGLSLVSSLAKPAGFFDPENPAGLRPEIPSEEEEDADEDGERGEEERRFGERSPFLSFSNTDLAFAGDLMAVGNYHGFNLYRLGAGDPDLISSVICPGGQGDVSIVGDILIMSVEDTRGRVDCGRQGVPEDISPDRFRGLRIFDISNPLAPLQVGQVQTCRGSHTHSVVSGPDADGTIIVYNSGIGRVRDEEELAGCVGEVMGDTRTALFRIDVVEIPVDDPSQARIIDSPTVFADEDTGEIAGLWQGGDHGDGTQTTSRTDECHDITVFPSLNLAAGACSGNGVLFDITDPRAPERIDAVVDTGFAYWHSATFDNDGETVLFTDEWGGGWRPRCQAQDPMNWGANAFYDIVDGKLEYRSHFKIPTAQSDKENCVAHNGSIVPVPGRDLFIQSWYQGGLSLIDFTDSANPVEIGFFDRGPIDAEQRVLGGFWSSYWYDGRIYATEIVRGLDVLELTATEHLTENEIAAAALADQGEIFNPQTQTPVSWPDHPVIALAYLDQLERSQTLSAETLAELRAALSGAAEHMEAGASDQALAAALSEHADALPDDDDDAATAARLTALSEVLEAVAGQVR